MADANIEPQQPGTFTTGKPHPARSKAGNLVRTDKQMANEAKAFAHDALMKMRESLSFSEKTAREDAQALAAGMRAWQSTREEWRYAYGKPLPGSKKPLPEQPKIKAKKLNKP